MPIALDIVATSLLFSNKDTPMEALPGLPLEAPSVYIVNRLVLESIVESLVIKLSLFF